ncbi:RHS repeat-associated core domain-containing protein [Sphingomonas sp. VNH70]|uniref:RHS repeat-associated core domain-containing protein n=1 Tax=Sphingomonas silueang TaxID=3156617 RepID=UPI0032B5525C
MSGSVLCTDPYPGTTNTGRFQYTGQAWIAELGLYYYKARMYSPGMGRFLQTDPIGYADGINWYNYVGGDPVNKRDPSGGCMKFIWDGKESVVQTTAYPGPCDEDKSRDNNTIPSWFWSPAPSDASPLRPGGSGGGGSQVPAPRTAVKPTYCSSPLYRLSSLADTSGKVLAGIGVAGVVGSGVATLITGGTALPITGPIALFSSRVAVLGSAIADLGAVGKASAAQGAGLSTVNVAASAALGLTVGRISSVFAGGAKGAGLGLFTGTVTDAALNAGSPDPCG